MGVRRLLDTHVLLWLLSTPERVPEPLRTELVEQTETIHVSAASAFEIATKHRIAKLDASALLDRWDDELSAAGLAALPITPAHALAAGRLEWDHRDPFDRLLAAQALAEGLELVTVDPAFRAAPELQIRSW